MTDTPPNTKETNKTAKRDLNTATRDLHTDTPDEHTDTRDQLPGKLTYALIHGTFFLCTQNHPASCTILSHISQNIYDKRDPHTE